MPARTRRLLAIGGVALATTACGPDHRQTGEAVLITWPLVVLLATLPQAMLVHAWRWQRVPRPVHWTPLLWLTAAATSTAVAVMLRASSPWEWTKEALWLFGTSYLSVLLVATRLWLMTKRRHVLLAPHLVTSAVFIPFAAALRADVFGASTFDAPAWFLVPGYGGAIPACLALLLWADCRFQRRAAQRREASRVSG